MSYKSNLLEAIEKRTATIGVVGMGYVGLPLAVEFAEVGFSVIAYDVDTRKVDLVNDGTSYIEDIPTERLAPLVDSGNLTATADINQLADANTISICVPTPLRKTKDPDMSYITQAVDAISNILQAGMLITLESTTYPGTTEEVIRTALEKDGLVVGDSLFIAFSPERIDPGNAVYGVRNTPKLVGGVTENCSEVAAALYGVGVDTIVKVSSPAAAEMVKLLENTFRAVNIGMVNEMAVMCDKLDIDIWEVIDAASTKPFGFMPFYPGPGLGGHCIPIDPHYLSWKMRTLNYTARFIELASDINNSMPSYVVGKVTDALNDHAKAVRGSKILVLGVAYKPNINDVRESPALDVIDLLHDKGAEVIYHDPLIASIRLENHPNMESAEYSAELLQSADCVVIITDHNTYDWQHVLDNSHVIVDTRNAVAGYQTNTPVITL